MRTPTAFLTGRFPVVALVALVLASLSGCGPDDPLPPGGVREVAIILDSDTLRPGQQRIARAVATGVAGVIVGAPVVWRSLTPSTLSVSPSGEVFAVSPGVGTLRATVGSVSTDRTVYLVNPPAVSFIVDPESLVLSLPGASAIPSVIPFDADGEPVFGAPLQWRSETPRIASVSASGQVTPQASGRTTVYASLDGLTLAVPVTVEPVGGPLAPRIDSVRPTTIGPGVPFTVYGARLGVAGGATNVVVDGLPAQVLSPGSAQFTAMLAAPGDACDPVRDVSVQVATTDGYTAAPVRLELAPQRSLALGEAALLLTTADAGCVELPSDGRYLVTVQHAARALGAGSIALTADFRTGSWPSAPTLRLAPSQPAALRDAHLGLLQQSQRYQPDGTRRSIAALQVPPVGGLTTLRVPDLDDARFCSAYRSITARTVYSGSRIAILEDTSGVVSGVAALARQMDASIVEVGAEVDATIWPLIERFGNPLVMDDRLDANGKVVLVLTPALNAMRGGAVMGAVVSCDFFPRASTPASNVGEMLYLQVPDRARYPEGGEALERWRAAVRGTIAHELKHVVGFAERIARGQLLEEIWLEEATARHAEELFTRSLLATTATGNTGYDALRCEALAQLGDPRCAGTPAMMQPTLEGLYDFLAAPSAHSPLGSLSVDASFYGSAWSLLRWAMDHAPGDEAAFVRALTVNGQSGVANLEARAGRSWDELLARWSLAVSTDGRAGVPVNESTLRYPSWELGDLFAGFCRDLGACLGGDVSGTFGRVHPLRPVVVAGDASVAIAEIVPAGFVAFTVEPAAGASRLIRLRGPGGAPLPNTARLAILRIE